MAISTRLAHPGELPLARAILQLPLCRDDNAAQHVYLALDAEAGRVVGAAAARVVEEDAVVWLEVLPSYRRRGIAKKLWKCLDPALSRTVLQTAWHGVSDEPSSVFAKSLGFFPKHETICFEAGIDSYLNYFQQWTQRFEARGVIPPDLEECYGAEVDLVEAQSLLAPLFGITIQQNLSRMVAYGVTSRDWIYALRVQDQLIAAVVGYFDGPIVCGDAYAVAPAFRNGWAQMVFKYRVVADAVRRRPELRTFRGTAGTGFSNTMKWSQRIGARYLDRKWAYERRREKA
jgi:GNAT superfamily N-acetyltransferase